MKNIKNIPVKPKDAGTLIIIKKEKKKSFVLMGQRPMSSRFMPGVFVFPGGVSEREDFLAYKVLNLKPNLNINKNKIKARSIIHAQSIMLTAIRETSEEAGLYLAKESRYKIQNYDVIKNNWGDFIKKLYLPKTNKLFFFGRAITPSTLRIRFHARFFIAFYEDFLGKIRTNGELENLDWYSLTEAKNKNIADVTEFMINEIIKLKNNYSSLPHKKNFPMFTWRRNKRWIKWDKIVD